MEASQSSNGTGANRIAIVGGLVAAVGFFIMPLLLLKPSPLVTSGFTQNLLAVQDDLRFLMLFFLCLVPVAIAMSSSRERRGWMLVIIGNTILVLSLWLPTVIGKELLENVQTVLPEASIRGPRIQPAGAMITGLAGGYVVLFGGLNDLRRVGVNNWVRLFAAWIGPLLIALMLFTGSFDIYSVMVEYSVNGDSLWQDTLQHLTYVGVALVTGLVIGIALGLWAARDERIAPIILYTVGIIQTIPSLALFGLLLVPLSNLGGELLTDTLVLLAAATAITVVLGGATVMLGSRWPDWRSGQVGLTLVSALAATIPLALATLIVVSLLFRVGFQAAITEDYMTGKLIFAGALALNAILLIAGRVMRMRDRTRDRLRRIRRGLSVVTLLGLLLILAQSGADFLPDTPIGDWSLRDIGIRGIGVTPTLVALTLYSLLPLVRNTYAGLNNVDAAIIDSGKGMGMTPRQIFFQIELPLAFPVIMAGVRNAAIALIGIATIATVVGGGGLGDYVIDGITNVSLDKILLGTIPAILLAFAVDVGLRVIETTLTSPGIRYVSNQ